MKKAVGYVLLGVIVNLGIAWLLAISIDLFRHMPDGAMRLTGDTGDTHWSLTRWRAFGSCQINSSWRHDANPGMTAGTPAELAPSWGNLNAPSPEFDLTHAKAEQRTVEARGWPLLSFWCEVDRIFAPATGPTVHSTLQGGLQAPFSPWVVASRPNLANITQPRVLPWRPIWRGLVFNSLVFAGAIWLAVSARKNSRKLIRRWRQQCNACGYDLRNNTADRCPECGTARSPLN